MCTLKKISLRSERPNVSHPDKRFIFQKWFGHILDVASLLFLRSNELRATSTMRLPLVPLALLGIFRAVNAIDRGRGGYDIVDGVFADDGGINAARRQGRRLKKDKQNGPRPGSGELSDIESSAVPEGDLPALAPTSYPSGGTPKTVGHGTVTSKSGASSPPKTAPTFSPNSRLPIQKRRSGKRSMGKLKISRKGGNTKSGKKSTKSKTGKGTPNKPCSFEASDQLVDVIPEVATMFPDRCCNHLGPMAVYVTHAQHSSDHTTPSGFDPFWDLVYNEIDITSEKDNICFVMTGYNPQVLSTRSLSEILIDATVLASSFTDVVAMMVTDPTDTLALMNEVRFISKDRTLPSIGVFNAGYDNVAAESLVTGEDRLPYIGFLSDTAFGTEAAAFSLELLDGVATKPLCFNGRPDLKFVGERCAAYYADLTPDVVDPGLGISCTAASKVEDILGLLVTAQANAIFSHVDCCQVVAQAVAMAITMGQKIRAVGCQDKDTSGDGASINFVTTQPILLEGYSPAAWANFPVRQALMGENGRGTQYFPSLASLVNTAIYTVPVS
jgi:hypothetical protein